MGLTRCYKTEVFLHLSYNWATFGRHVKRNLQNIEHRAVSLQDIMYFCCVVLTVLVNLTYFQCIIPHVDGTLRIWYSTITRLRKFAFCRSAVSLLFSTTRRCPPPPSGVWNEVARLILASSCLPRWIVEVINNTAAGFSGKPRDACCCWWCCYYVGASLRPCLPRPD